MSEDIGKFFNKSIAHHSGKNIWFTSDTHFSHENIIKFCKRPFANADEMNEEMIKRWNERVKPGDIVYHLGDFAWGGSEVWNSILDRLNGEIHLILGNHDLKNMRQGYITKFASVSFQKQIYVENRLVYLNHYPFLCYAGTYRGEQAVWQLFGHVHSRNNEDISDLSDEEVKEILGKDAYRLKYLLPTQYDVGADNNNYQPISWEEVKEKINKQVELFNSKQA